MKGVLTINCRGPHDDGFGENFRVDASSTEPVRCPKCGNTEASDALRVLGYQ